MALLPEKGTDKLVGFTCGTLTQSDSLTHESMARHEADGTLLCLHSVCIDRAYQRRGFAMRMLQAYLIFIQQTSPQVKCLHRCLLFSLSEPAKTPVYCNNINAYFLQGKCRKVMYARKA